MQNLINEKIKELTENGKLDEIVTQSAIKFIQNIVNETLSSYGDVGKKYKDRLQQSLLSGLESVDFVCYSKVLTDLIESELNKTVVSIGIEPVKEMIKSFTGELEKKEWKLSEIIERFIEEEVSSDNESGEISFTHSISEYGSEHIAFDKEDNKLPYNCKYRLMINTKTKKLYSPTVEGLGLHPISEMGLYGFDLFLFKLYAIGCTIECDVNKVETEWSNYN